MQPLLYLKENIDAPHFNIIIIQDNEPYKPVHYQSKSHKCQSKEVCNILVPKNKGQK